MRGWAIIEQAVLEKAAMMTGIGMGTAFALLLVLMAILLALRFFACKLTRVTQPPDSAQLNGESGEHDKALAAAVSVIALRAKIGVGELPIKGDG